MINGSIDWREAACHVLTQIVNSLTAKMEIGTLLTIIMIINFVHSIGNPMYVRQGVLGKWIQNIKKVIKLQSGIKEEELWQSHQFRITQLDQQSMTIYASMIEYNYTTKNQSQDQDHDQNQNQNQNLGFILKVSYQSDSDTNSDIVSTTSDHVDEGYDTDVEMTEYFDIPHTVYRNSSIKDEMITLPHSPTLQNLNGTDKVTCEGDVSDFGLI